MSHFETAIASPLGDEERFALTLERTRTGFHGTMDWGHGQYQVNSARRDGPDRLFLMLRRRGAPTRTWIVAYADESARTLSIRPLCGAFDYAMTDEGFTASLAFVDGVQVVPTVPAQPMLVGSLDQILDQAVIRQRSVCLYLGSNLQKNLPVRFSACAVDGAAVSVEYPKPLPYETSSFLELGYFEPGEVIANEWAMQAWNVPVESAVAIGAFRDGTLAKRTPLASQKLRPFLSFRGSVNLTV